MSFWNKKLPIYQLSDEAYEIVRKIAEKYDETEGAVLSEAIGLIGLISEAQFENKKIFIADEDGTLLNEIELNIKLVNCSCGK